MRGECVQANKSSSENASASNMRCMCVCVWWSRLKMQYIRPRRFRLWLHGMAKPPSGNLFGKCYAKHAALRRTQIKHLVWSMSHNIKCRCWIARRCYVIFNHAIDWCCSFFLLFDFAWRSASFFTLVRASLSRAHRMLSTRNKVTQTTRSERSKRVEQRKPNLRSFVWVCFGWLAVYCNGTNAKHIHFVSCPYFFFPFLRFIISFALFIVVYMPICKRTGLSIFWHRYEWRATRTQSKTMHFRKSHWDFSRFGRYLNWRGSVFPENLSFWWFSLFATLCEQQTLSYRWNVLLWR